MFGGKKKSGPISGRVDTLIAKSARVHGDIEFAGGLHLDGEIIGNVRAMMGENATLWVSEQGRIEGTVEVPSVVLNGSVQGDVHASERVVIGAQARITGNVHYATIEMVLGAEVNGKLLSTAAGAAASGRGAAGKPAEAARPQDDSPVRSVA